jgi:hypothetical protein
MKWYYESNGHPKGPILETELRKLKEEGRISAECLIWTEGMEDWLPLEKVREFGPAPRLTKGDPELNLPGVEREAPIVLHKGPAGANHSLKSVPDTGADLPEQDRETDSHREAPAELRDGKGASTDCSLKWECPGPGGPLLELLPSTVEILFSPARVFAKFRKDGGWGMPLAYLAILNAIGTVLVLWTVEQLPPTGSVFSKMLRFANRQDVSTAMVAATLIGGTLVLPITAVCKAGFLHLLMRLAAGSKAPFSTTFRAASYAMGAASALWIVPFGAVWACGFSGQPLVVEAAMLLSAGATGVWSLSVLLQALARSHQVTLWRTALAILVPPFTASILLGIALASASISL